MFATCSIINYSCLCRYFSWLLPQAPSQNHRVVTHTEDRQAVAATDLLRSVDRLSVDRQSEVQVSAVDSLQEVKQFSFRINSI